MEDINIHAKNESRNTTYLKQEKCQKSFFQNRVRFHHDKEIVSFYHRKFLETLICPYIVQFLHNYVKNVEK